jgi:hypothetical protein
MLGRSSYTQEEFDRAKTSTDATLAAYDRLAEAVATSGDSNAAAALEALEPHLFNDLALALDRPFVHRIRKVAGKDANPLNETELIVESLMAGDGFRESSVLEYDPDGSVLKLAAGDRIALDRAQFERLHEAFLADLRAKFV